MTSSENVVFLHDENSDASTAPSVRTIQRPAGNCITLQHLHDECLITSVWPCNAEGQVLPRTLRLERPEDILTRGGHYLVRRKQPGKEHTMVENDMSSKDAVVTFERRLMVREFGIDHQPNSTTASSPSLLYEENDENMETESNNRKRPRIDYVFLSHWVRFDSNPKAAGSGGSLKRGADGKCFVTLDDVRWRVQRSQQLLQKSAIRTASALSVIRSAKESSKSIRMTLQGK